MSTVSTTVCWGLNSLSSEEEHSHVKIKNKCVMQREKTHERRKRRKLNTK